MYWLHDRSRRLVIIVTGSRTLQNIGDHRCLACDDRNITTGFITPVLCAEPHYSSTSLTLNTKMLLTLAVLTLVPRLTGGRHTPDLVQILLRPQLLEAQALAEALSPSSRHRGGEAAVTSARLAGCEVSWALARPGGGGGVVFLVAGRDRAGMWNLLATNLTSTSLQLDPRLAAKLQQAAVFAVSGRGVEASSLTVETEAAGECREAVPAPGQWSEVTEAGLHTGDFPRGVGHRVENGWVLTKVAVVLLNGLIW